MNASRGHGLRASIRENVDYDDSASDCSDVSSSSGSSSSSEEEATLHSEARTKSGRAKRNA